MAQQFDNRQQDLSEVLNGLDTYTKRGKELADKSVSLLNDTVREASRELQKSIDKLHAGDYRDRSVAQSLANQLYTIRTKYELLSQAMESQVGSLAGGTFSITLFGRTTAGKSTLMTVLTHGDGSQIGNGSQRTTRDVRVYTYRGLEVTDVPGIAAFAGEEDEAVAFESARQGDLVLFLITDDAPQQSEAECLSLIKNLGKPMICLVNVKVGIQNTGHMDETDFEDFRDDVENKFSNRDDLAAIRKNLIDYGPEYGQDWTRIPFAYVHLKAAQLSQKNQYSRWSNELFKLSHFEDAERLIIQEVHNKGGFYRLKTYADTVSVPMVEALEELFSQSAENSEQGRLLIQKRRKHESWIDDFQNRANARITAFLMEIEDDLKQEASAFAEENYNDKDASKKWAQIVSSRDIDTSANDLLKEFECECEDELRDIGREIDFDIKLVESRFVSDRLKTHEVIDTKRAWNWTTGLLSGGLVVVALFAGPELAVAGTVVGVVGAIGNFFFGDFETKKREARRQMETQLDESIHKMVSKLDRKLQQIVDAKLVYEQLKPMSRKISGTISSLFDLSATQRSLAIRINRQLSDVNRMVVEEAMSYRGYNNSDAGIIRVVRIPGDTTMLLLADGTKLPYKLKYDLSELLSEEVRYVFDSEDKHVLVSRVLGRSCERRNIRIERVKDEPLIAHIEGLDELEDNAQTGIRLAEQLTELLIAS